MVIRTWRTVLFAAAACTISEPSGPARSNDRDAADAPTPAAAAPGRTPAQVRESGNQLVGQPSPYLEQHAHNPVDWYPWSDAALQKAIRENKPIFLSIGYSTCHWCHVMERESFEDDDVAAFLNEHFVSIKVDREWRPDIDAIYIDAVAALGGSTGWPLTVFLTPNLEPFYGGTYYPRHGQHGRPGFLDVLHEVQRTWQTDGPNAAAQGRAILARIEAQASASVKSSGSLGVQLLDDAMRALEGARDPGEGGFGRRQKFPNTPLLLAELRHVRRTGNADSRAHLVLTLEKMMSGGIRDHLGGGFHRYAVDPRWHLPHFEKTLYDNAQLAALYIESGQILGRDDFQAVGRGVLDELLESWREPSGGFIVGFDADDAQGEGAYYCWRITELRELLMLDAAIVSAAFDVTAEGEHELQGCSVLHRRPDAEVASALGTTETDVAATIARALPIMKATRSQRPAPARDDKILTGWNGLAIAALADAGRRLQEPRYIEAARTAADFIVRSCWDADAGRMLRGRRGTTPLDEGVLEDYALFGLSLLRLHAATGDPSWLMHADAIATQIVQRFYDPSTHAFMRTPPDAAGVPVRMADLHDNVLPSGGAAAIQFLLELGAIAGDTARYDRAVDVLGRIGTSAATRPFSAGWLLAAIDHATAPVREVVVAGEPEDPITRALLAEVDRTDPARVLPVRLPAEGAAPELSARFPALQGKKAIKGRATAYVCEKGRCDLPTSDPVVLRRQLRAAFADDRN